MGTTPLRLTILGMHYAPEPSGNAPYTTRLAEGLARRGIQVRVVTAYPHYPQWRIAEGYEGLTRREVVGGVPLTRLRSYVPKQPTPLRRAAAETSFGARLVTSGWSRPDVVLCVSPALLASALALARLQSSWPRPAVGLLMQDLYSVGASETGTGGGLVTRALTGIESWVARRATGVVVIHDRFKGRVIDSLGVDPQRVTVIRNWTHVRPVLDVDRAVVRRQMGWPQDETVVLHTGAMGEKQALSNVVEAARVADAEGSAVRFVLVGDGGQRSQLEELASGIQRIHFIDPLPGDLYGQAMKAADLLLVNEKPGVIEMAVPSKLTSYFSTGRPVLAATDPLSTTAAEIEASGAGIRIDPGDPKELLRAATELGADHARLSRIGPRGPAYCATVLSEEAALDAYEAWVRRLHVSKTRG